MTRHALDCGISCGLSACNCGAQGKFRVLLPIYEKTGEINTDSDGNVVKWHRVRFEYLGYASGMADALANFPRCKRNGYSPVLEFCGSLH